MNKKKILYLITKATWGGAQKYVFDLVTHLPKSEFNAVVAYGVNGRLAEMLQKEGTKTHRVSSLGRNVAIVSDISSFFQTLMYMWQLKPDIVHLNSSKAAALGALAARLCGVRRIIFTVHGWPFKENRSTLARAIMYFVSWFTALLSHSTIVVSKSDEMQGKRMWLVGKKIRYIPIGIEPPSFLSREEASRALRITATLPRVVTNAELTKNKGIRYGIESVALLKKQNVDISYYILGDGEEREALKRLALEQGVSDRVHFSGFVSDAAQYMKAFDIFLLPSIKEGMPYVLLEAAAAGLSVITTTVVNPDVLERYENIRAVPPADPQAIVEAIVILTRERNEREMFPLNATYPLSNMLNATLALYR